MDVKITQEIEGNFYYEQYELDLCDEDIQEACKKIGCYMAGLPTMMQLVKELRLLREALERNKV